MLFGDGLLLTKELRAKVSERAITSVAILKVNWDKGKDYIDNFVPFLAECLRASPQPEVSLVDLQDAFVNCFRLKVPQGALKTILNRAARQGFVQKAHGIYRRNDSLLESSDLSSVRAEVLRKHEGLLTKLIAFCDSEHKIKWSQEEADAALLSYIHERSTPILAAALEGQAIIPYGKQVKNSDYLVSSFIRCLSECDPEGFDFLETIVKGSMLANVLVFQDLGSIKQRFENVEVYFDTNFLLRALGHAGEVTKAACTELIELLYEQNAQLRCFEHNLEEIRNILHAASVALKRPEGLRQTSGETIEYFARTGYRPSDVEFEIARLEKKLAALRIKIKPKPDHVEHLSLNEVLLESVLREEVGYQRPEPLKVDIDSIAATHRLRQGRFPVHMETCYAIFVTTNHSLARASILYFQKAEGKNAVGTVPHCLSDYVITTLLWIKKPLSASDLPRKRIIADCYAALNPPDSLWRRFLHEIDRLQKQGNITEDDYHLLRLSMEAKAALMDITLGDTSAFSEGTIDEVLGRAKASARAETESCLRQESDKRADAERRAGETEGKLMVYRQNQSDKFARASTFWGYWASRAILAGVLIVVLVGTYQTLPEPYPDLAGAWVSFLLPGIFGLIAMLSIANLLYGTTIISLTKRIEIRISHWVARKLNKILGASTLEDNV